MMAPPLFVLRSDDGIWKSVVEPMLLTENKVEVARVAVLGPITKRVSGEPSVGVEVKTESLAKGEVVPIPRFPTLPSKKNGETPALPNRTVEDAWNPAVRSSGVPVEFVVAPKAVVEVNGNAKFW